MRVLVAVEQLRRGLADGISTYTRGLLLGLSRLGTDRPDISLLASRPPGGPDPLHDFGLPVLASPLPGPLLTRAWDRGLWAAPHGFDLVHSVSQAMPPVRAGRGSLMVHDLAWREVPDTFPPRGRRWHEASLQRAIAAGHLLVVPSTRTADLLVADGVDATRVEVVPHGCDHLAPVDDAATDRLLARVGITGPFLLTVSTLEPRKNLARLLQAYALARPQLPEPWPLLVVGAKGWGDALSGSVPHGAVLAGSVQGGALTGLYRRARCFAYVPLVEGFGLPPLEAMQECTPVVASPLPSTSAGDAVLEVDPFDVAAIAAGLIKASSDEPARSQLVTAGLDRAAELTWEACARRHVELWEAWR